MTEIKAITAFELPECIEVIHKGFATVAAEFHIYQGKGYGGYLLKHAIDYAKEHKYNSICLDTRNELSVARHLYEKNKFKQIISLVDHGCALTDERHIPAF